MTGELRLVTADDLCVGAQTVLAAQLGDLIEALELGSGRTPYLVPKIWNQVPELTSINAAISRRAVAAIASPGIVGNPVTRRSGIDATWVVRVGIYDHGSDYNVTAQRVRTWAALVRATVLRNQTLGGVASAVRLAGESYRLYPEKGVARTLGGCQVDFQVDVRNIADLSALDGVLPTVLTTFSTVTLDNHQE